MQLSSSTYNIFFNLLLTKFHFSVYFLYHKLAGTIAPHLPRFTKWLEENAGTFICQNPLNPIRLARGDFDLVNDKEYLDQAHQMVAPHLSFDAFINFIYQYFTIFYSATDWMAYLRSCDFSYGSRLHGNILAFQAECPAAIIPHDSRTHELADTLKLPTVPLAVAKTCDTLEQFIDAVEFDGDAYDTNRKVLAKRYASVLSSIGIEFTDLLNVHLN